MIKIEGLTILFKTFKLCHVELEIKKGEFHFLLGPTGSGKTLLLESIAGLHKPKKGKIWLEEKEVQNLSPEKREISYVPQDLALFPHMNVMENILYGIKARGLPLKEYESYINNLISITKIESLLDRYPARLSGGEKKRVALLRGLASKPKLLLLDEPLSGLDPGIKFEIQQLLKAIHDSFRPTILCVSHDFEEAFLLADRITVFVEGKVEQVGTKEDIFLRPKSKKVAQFLGLKNLYRVDLLKMDQNDQRCFLSINGILFSIPAALYDGGDRQVDLFIRPEEVMVLREGKPIKESLKRNILEGEIKDLINRGRYHLIHFQTKKGKVDFEIHIPNYVFRNLELWKGKEVKIALRDQSFWVMNHQPHME
ncbi:MAG: ABC transporter ATP-binding protein [Thermodesulfobacteriota bacterium]